MIISKIFVLISAFLLLESLLLGASVNADNSLVQEVNSNPPKPPDRGTPTNDNGTPATRGNCPETELALRPVLPKRGTEFYGFTFSEYPQFWFYIPYPANEINQGVLRIEDGAGNLHAQISFVLPETPGFVSVPLEVTEKPLEINKQYYWIFVLDCASPEFAEPARDWQQGWIERVERPDLEMQLQTATAEQLFNLYWENQIWYDVPMNLGEIRKTLPIWRKLLQAVGMEDYLSEPVAGAVNF